MKFLCLCPTYLRPHLVANALACFEVQDYPAELRRLLIYDDAGTAKKPGDYIKEFTAFINSHSNDIPALVTVLTRPRDLTRKQLRALALSPRCLCGH